MRRKCFISFKKEDTTYKNTLIKKFKDSDVINKTLNQTIDSDNGDYIMTKIRDEYLYDSSVTIFLIGKNSSENEGYDFMGRDKQYFIKKELQASLFNRNHKKRSGILGVVLPEMYEKIYGGETYCHSCNGRHNIINIDDSTTIKEFSANFYIQDQNQDKCSWTEEERYCVLVKWDDFINNIDLYVEKAFSKREKPIANKVKVYVD